MQLVPPPPDAATREPLRRRLFRLLVAQWPRVLFLVFSAALGWFCRELPEGIWREWCAWLASAADTVAGMIL